jgi:hypothetical protein
MANNENILRRPWRMKTRVVMMKVKTRPGKEFELLRICFNITNINILNFILLYFLGLLEIENYCRYVISFTYKKIILKDMS